jgi:hypothetical protein
MMRRINRAIKNTSPMPGTHPRHNHRTRSVIIVGFNHPGLPLHFFITTTANQIINAKRRIEITRKTINKESVTPTTRLLVDVVSNVHDDLVPGVHTQLLQLSTVFVVPSSRHKHVKVMIFLYTHEKKNFTLEFLRDTKTFLKLF